MHECLDQMVIVDNYAYMDDFPRGLQILRLTDAYFYKNRRDSSLESLKDLLVLDIDTEISTYISDPLSFPNKLVALKLPIDYQADLINMPDTLRILRLAPKYMGELRLSNTRIQSMNIGYPTNGYGSYAMKDWQTYDIRNGDMPDDLYELVIDRGFKLVGSDALPKNLHTLYLKNPFHTKRNHMVNLKETNIKDLSLNQSEETYSAMKIELPNGLEKLSLNLKCDFQRIHRMIPNGIKHLELNITKDNFFDLRQLPVGLISLTISYDLFDFNVELLGYRFFHYFLDLQYLKVGKFQNTEYLKTDWKYEYSKKQTMLDFKVFCPSLYPFGGEISSNEKHLVYKRNQVELGSLDREVLNLVGL